MRERLAESTDADADLVLRPSTIIAFASDAHQVSWLIITRGKTRRCSLEAAPVHSQSALRRTPNSSSRFWLEHQLLPQLAVHFARYFDEPPCDRPRLASYFDELNLHHNDQTVGQTEINILIKFFENTM